MCKNYKKLLRLFFISFMLNSLACIVCLAEERREDKPADDIVRAYILHDNVLFPVFFAEQQPTEPFDNQGFSAGIRGNGYPNQYSADTFNNTSNYNPADLILSYYKKLEIFQLGADYVNYLIANIFLGTLEPFDIKNIFALVGLDEISLPTLTISEEIGNYNQWSLLLNISHTYEFNKNISLKSNASAGYSILNNMSFIQNYDCRITNMINQHGGFYDGTVSFALPIKVTESFYIIPSFTYAFPLNNDSRNDLRSKGIVSPIDRSSSIVYGGLSLSFTF